MGWDRMNRPRFMNRKSSFTLFLIGIFYILSISSCSQSESSNQVATGDIEKKIERNSPIGVLQSFTEAKKTKNIEAMKEALSKSTLETIEGVATDGYNQSIDEYLAPGNTTPLNRPNMPDTRNEVIQDDIATVEISRFPGDSWRKLTFVKEDGKWKMDLNLFMNELYPSVPSEDSTAPPPSKNYR